MLQRNRRWLTVSYAADDIPKVGPGGFHFQRLVLQLSLHDRTSLQILGYYNVLFKQQETKRRKEIMRTHVDVVLLRIVDYFMQQH